MPAGFEVADRGQADVRGAREIALGPLKKASGGAALVGSDHARTL